MKKQILIFDTEIIGKNKPVFLVCIKNLKTKEIHSFWDHKRGHAKQFLAMIDDPKYTWVGFNSNRFDAALLAAWAHGHDAENLKVLAEMIIKDERMPWDVLKEAGCEPLKFDHIDIFDVAPGVATSLKTYMGRLFYKSLVDLPFHHDDDLTPKQQAVLEAYCCNDIGGTEALFKSLEEEIQLRYELSEEHGLDLRSKSDAQIAEAILKKAAGISGKPGMPSMVQYKAPAFIQTQNMMISDLIDSTEEEMFKINYANGSPIEAEWMSDPISINDGLYKYGLGGLHSQHDVNFYAEATDNYLISDFDVASYYPSIMLACGYAPRLGGNKGELFMEAYRDIFDRRLAAKRTGDKKVSNSLKITLNGTFGKLGSPYCSFYSPDLLIAVTITGQLNLLTLIDDLERTKGVKVLSANTDGIMVGYQKSKRAAVLKTIAVNAKRTGFEYEETPYRKVAMKDVNNYIAITIDGKVKAKGLYASAGLMKNPTMPVCAMAATQYLLDGTLPEKFIKRHKRFIDFTAIRNVKGGGIQHTKWIDVDDWTLFEDNGSAKNIWHSPYLNKYVTRMSKPKSVRTGDKSTGAPFGRVARWYMTKDDLPPLTYVSNGNTVPKTEGAKLCMILPASMPTDLNRDWYVRETYQILMDIGAMPDALRQDKAA